MRYGMSANVKGAIRRLDKLDSDLTGAPADRIFRAEAQDGVTTVRDAWPIKSGKSRGAWTLLRVGDHNYMWFNPMKYTTIVKVKGTHGKAGLSANLIKPEAKRTKQRIVRRLLVLAEQE